MYFQGAKRENWILAKLLKMVPVYDCIRLHWPFWKHLVVGQVSVSSVLEETLETLGRNFKIAAINKYMQIEKEIKGS